MLSSLSWLIQHDRCSKDHPFFFTHLGSILAEMALVAAYAALKAAAFDAFDRIYLQEQPYSLAQFAIECYFWAYFECPFSQF